MPNLQSGLAFVALAASLAVTGCAARNTAGSSAVGPAPSGSIGPNTLNVADAAIAGGDPNMALSVSQSILSNDPNNVDALVHEGEAYYALDRCPASEASFQVALKYAPKSAAAETGLGRCLLKVDPVRAEAAFLAATQDDPGNAASFNDLGIARDLQDNFAGAASAYQQALMDDPGSDATAVNLGLSLALSGQGNEALQYLGPLATGAGATPKIREDYAVALLAAGRADEARQILAVDMPPDQIDSAMEGYQTLIGQAITSPPPPQAAAATQPQVQTAPVMVAQMQSSTAPTPLAPAATPAPAPVAAPDSGAGASRRHLRIRPGGGANCRHLRIRPGGGANCRHLRAHPGGGANSPPRPRPPRWRCKLPPPPRPLRWRLPPRRRCKPSPSRPTSTSPIPARPPWPRRAPRQRPRPRACRARRRSRLSPPTRRPWPRPAMARCSSRR